MKHHKLLFLIPVLLIALFFLSCTNLDENPVSQVTPDNFFSSESDLLAAVVPVYENLRQFSNNAEYPNVQAVSSDEIFVPTRGLDWFDGGQWITLQTHTWTPTQPQIKTVYSDMFRGVARANGALSALEASTLESALIPTLIAEVRFLRAFFYWALMDVFGNVPIVTGITDPDNPPQQNTSQEVFNFVVDELTAVLPDLEEVAPAYGRATKGAANALLATVYLNAEVYSGTPRWNECVTACDAVINSGRYSLVSTFTGVFAVENEGNPEIIFLVPHLALSGVSWNRHMMTLHYSQIPASPWNGFSVLADSYNRYDPDDDRFAVLLSGPQFILSGPNEGEPAFQRDGVRLDFVVDSPLSGANESHGVRINKFPLDPAISGSDAGNDFILFRYAHILLAKAEALFNLGSAGEALALVNQVRARSFEPDKPLAALTSDLILDERGFEFLWEGFRRSDQIRHRRFLDAWTLKDASDGPHRNLMPIPQVQLDANPNLTQDPGY